MIRMARQTRSPRTGKRIRGAWGVACAVVGLALAMPAFAQQGSVAAQGAFARHSCGYYSTTTGDLLVSFVPQVPIEAGARVYMHFGWEFPAGASERTVWSDITDVPMKQVRLDANGAPIWDAAVARELHYRSSSRAPIDALDFVFRIEHPDGSVSWEKGIETEWGYYRVNWESMRMPCVSAESEMPPFEPLDVTVVP